MGWHGFKRMLIILAQHWGKIALGQRGTWMFLYAEQFCAAKSAVFGMDRDLRGF